jgi:hypothetical protein
MGNVKVVMNRAGVAALLKSPEVLHDLEGRAERIANAAGEGFDTHAEVGLHRARAAVVTGTPAAVEANARTHALTRALDAGR